MRSPFHRSLIWILSFTTLAFTACIQKHSIAGSPDSDELGRRFGSSVLMIEESGDPCDDAYDGTCGWGTHDSCPVFQIAPKETVSETVSDKPARQAKSSDGVEEVMATFVSSVGSSFGISVMQFAEPFAMFGPNGNSTLDEISWLNKYWTHPESIPFAKVIDADAVTNDIPAKGEAQDDVDFDVVSFVPFVDFDGLVESHACPVSVLASAAVNGSHFSTKSNEVNCIDWKSHDDDRFDVVAYKNVIELQQDTPLLQESSDVTQVVQEAKGSLAIDSLAVETAAVSEGTQEADSRQGFATGNSNASRNRLVGSSCMVATIDEVLLPYDFSWTGEYSRNLFPLESGAYCVLERTSLPEAEFDHNRVLETAANDGVETRFVDVEVFAAETMSNLVVVLNKYPQWRRLLRTKNYGRQLGRLASVVSQTASRGVVNVASKLPRREIAIDSPSDELLARAEAVVEDENQSLSQSDQVRSDQLRRTVAVLFQATDSIQEWLRVARQSSQESDDRTRSGVHR